MSAIIARIIALFLSQAPATAPAKSPHPPGWAAEHAPESERDECFEAEIAEGKPHRAEYHDCVEDVRDGSGDPDDDEVHDICEEY